MASFNKPEFGRRLRDARNRTPLTQAQLGDRIADFLELGDGKGVSGAAVAQWENGSSLPTADKLAAACSILGVSADSLLLLAEPTKRPPGFLDQASALPEPLQEALLQIVSHLAEKTPSEKRLYRKLEQEAKQRK